MNNKNEMTETIYGGLDMASTVQAIPMGDGEKSITGDLKQGEFEKNSPQSQTGGTKSPAKKLSIIDKNMATSDKIETRDIDWEAGARAGLTEDEVFILTYFADIECQTIGYMKDLMNTRVGFDPDVIAFLTVWNYEEFFHGHFLGQLLQVCGHGLEERRIANVRKNSSIKERFEMIASKFVSTVFHKEYSAIYASFGAIQELTTLRGYERLGETTKNPVLKILCERIAKQERRHFAWYFNKAKESLLVSTRAQKMTKFIMNMSWTPVGAGVKTPAEVHRLVRSLFGAEQMGVVADEIDKKIATLPGLEGLCVMSRYMSEAGLVSPKAALG